jgi:hypothetical protein
MISNTMTIMLKKFNKILFYYLMIAKVLNLGEPEKIVISKIFNPNTTRAVVNL